MNKLLTSAALLVVIATTSTIANADMHAGKVKCLGIAKAGKNDCKATDGAHSCAGQAKTDNAATEWKFAASAEECTKEGGKVAEAEVKM